MGYPPPTPGSGPHEISMELVSSVPCGLQFVCMESTTRVILADIYPFESMGPGNAFGACENFATKMQ